MKGPAKRPRVHPLRSLAAVLGLSVIVHLVVLGLFPYVYTDYLAEQLAERWGRNAFHHARRPDADERDIPMPSPDLLYSAGAFDLTHGPLRITAPLSGDYASLSFYADNMDNFFVENDRELQEREFAVLLVGQRSKVPPQPGCRLVRAPSDTGIMLVRYFVADEAAAARIDRMRRRIRCFPIQ